MANRTSGLIVVGLVVGTAMTARAEPDGSQPAARVTVVTYEKVSVPWYVLLRAQRVATAAFASVGVEVKWVHGKRLGEKREPADGRILTLVFDGPAPKDVAPKVMAYASLGGNADADVRVFFDRLAVIGSGLWDSSARLDKPRCQGNVLGNVLAHELTHALEGVPRHSSEGLMKPNWSEADYAVMIRGTLPFAPEDLALLRARFQKEIPHTLTLANGH